METNHEQFDGVCLRAYLALFGKAALNATDIGHVGGIAQEIPTGSAHIGRPFACLSGLCDKVTLDPGQTAPDIPNCIQPDCKL